MFFPTVKETPQTEVMTSVFGGYNHNLRIGEGQSNVKPVSALEFYDEENLTSDFYPMMANRAKRGEFASAGWDNKLLGAVEHGGKIYTVVNEGGEYPHIYVTPDYRGTANRQDITEEVLLNVTDTDPKLSWDNKKFATMGAYIIILPDKVYFNTEKYYDSGYIDVIKDVQVGYYTPCDIDGNNYIIEIETEEPSNPTEQTLWETKVDDKVIFKRYSSGKWIDVQELYVKIFMLNFSATDYFRKGDVIDIAGAGIQDGALNEFTRNGIRALNGSKKIQAIGTNYIVVAGLIDIRYGADGEYTQIGLSRTMPDMDYVVEANNRLWGCKYGYSHGDKVNEIYACALGDFKNWRKYEGISTDSYTASVGTPGKWTGAINYRGVPLFFKEDSIHKVYVSSTGAHQIKSEPIDGVAVGAGDTLKEVNGVLYYCSKRGPSAYDGSRAVAIGNAIGDSGYKGIAAGALNAKYYLFCRGPQIGKGKTAKDNFAIFAYDTEKRVWHKESTSFIANMKEAENDIYSIDEHERKLNDSGTFVGASGALFYASYGEDGFLMAVDETKRTTSEFRPFLALEKIVPWSATTGLIGYTASNHKYISRMKIRMVLPKESWMKISIEYDSDGVWHSCGKISGVGTKSFVLPVRPRRCDHFRLKLEGEGDFRIYSITKVHEQGSDVE